MINISILINSTVQAVNINSANIISGGDCGSLLNYDGVPRIVCYTKYLAPDGEYYPAYCLDRNKTGVSDSLSYSVSVSEAITDVELWKIIINGYPYKTLKELGCLTKEEAFTATKQAIYCYIHKDTINVNGFTAIGEAGDRTLKALKQILNDASKCTETQITNTVRIVKEYDNFKIDNIEKEYVSKVYSIQAKTNISDYKVNLQKNINELPEGIKVTDLDNNIKNEFKSNEKFKILIPIKKLTEKSDFNIQVNTKINNKPVLYGEQSDSTRQNYALTAATYEDAEGNTKETYFKNETKIKIIKQDKETKERLENVEFNILNENKKVIYAGLKTNSQGEIELDNFLPGKYYIQETNTRDGYLLNEKLIEFILELNERITITIDNLFEQVPEIEITNKHLTETIDNLAENPPKVEISEKQITETIVNKLPVTGM